MAALGRAAQEEPAAGIAIGHGEPELLDVEALDLGQAIGEEDDVPHLDRLGAFVDRAAAVDAASGLSPRVDGHTLHVDLALARDPEPEREAVRIGGLQRAGTLGEAAGGAERGPQPLQIRRTFHAPNDLAQRGAAFHRRRKRRVVRTPDLDFAAVQGLEVESVRRFAYELEAPVEEEPAALREVFDAVGNAVDTENAHCANPFSRPSPAGARSAPSTGSSDSCTGGSRAGPSRCPARSP